MHITLKTSKTNKTSKQLILLLFLFFPVVVFAGGIQTDRIDFATTTGAAVTGNTYLDCDEFGRLIFRDTATGTTRTVLQESGTIDHTMLQNLNADSHPYLNFTRFAEQLGNLISSSTKGANWNSGIAIPTDSAGYSTLGGHVSTDVIHAHRLPRVVTVGPNDGNKKAEFTSIQSALNSITDSSSAKRYIILVYPNTYVENVTWNKNYVSLIGVGKDSCIVESNTGSPAVNITCTNPVIFENMTFKNTASGGVAVQDASASNIFKNCKFWSSRGIGHSITSGENVNYYNCEFDDTGLAGVTSFAVSVNSGVNTVYAYFWNCYFSSIKGDSIVLRVVTANAMSQAYFYDCWQNKNLVLTGTNGSFRLDSPFTVNLISFDFSPFANIVDNLTFNGLFTYGAISAAVWEASGSLANGYTSLPLTVFGTNISSDINMSNSGIRFNGYYGIDWNRNATFNSVSATTGTFEVLTGGKVSVTTNSALVGDSTTFTAQAKVSTPLLSFTTSTLAPSFGSRADTTSSAIRIILDKNNRYSGAYKKLQLTDGERNTSSYPAWELLEDGDTGIFRFNRSADGLAFSNLTVDSNGTRIGYSSAATANQTFWWNNGDITNRLTSTDGSDYFKILDGGNNQLFAVNSDGKVDATSLTVTGDNVSVRLTDASSGRYIALTTDSDLPAITSDYAIYFKPYGSIVAYLSTTIGMALYNDKRLQFGNSTGNVGFIEYDTAQTIDTLIMGLDDDVSGTANSRGLIVCDTGDAAFDFSHAAQSNPTMFIHSANQSTTEWISFSHSGTNGVIDVGTGLVSFPDGIIIPDNAVTQTFMATSNYDENSTNVTRARNGYYTGTNNACLHLNFPIPTYQNGAKVVIDSIGIQCLNFDSGQYLQKAYLIAIDRTNGNEIVAAESNSMGGSGLNEMLASDYTMNPDYFYKLVLRWYWTSGTTARVLGYKVVYHTTNP